MLLAAASLHANPTVQTLTGGPDPASAQAGQVYALTLTHADGGPDLSTEHNFETRSAEVAVDAPAAPASTTSDDWKMHFFGSTTNSLAVNNLLSQVKADADGDGADNWREYVTGTDATNPQSCLKTSAVAHAPQGKGYLIHWPSVVGKRYVLEPSDNLFNPNWTPV